MDVELLTEVVTRRRKNRNLIELIEKAKAGTLTNDEGNALREVVSDEFLRRGIEDDHEPNTYGLRLEQLIDDLAHRMEGM